MNSKVPKLGDSVIAVALLVLAITGIIALESYGFDVGQPPGLRGYLLAVLMTVPIAWRQVFPRSVLWIVFLAWSTNGALGYVDGAGIFGVIVAMYGIGLYLPRKKALINGGIVAALAVAWTAVGVFAPVTVHPLALVQVIIAFVVPLEIGILDSRRQQRLTELEVSHSRREQAHQRAAADAVRAERARIARELHDVVAHEVTVMTLQAEGAKRRAKDADPAITGALSIISESGRRGLEEMQRVIGVLRATEEEALSTADADHARAGQSVSRHGVLSTDDLSPMPSLAALPALVEKVEAAGLPVHLQVTGSSHVPAGVELSAYRIVQESLTNAMKHAGPGATAEVTVDRLPNQVTITVEDDGRGVISEAAVASGGHGIAGMKERVAALGGDLDFGVRKGGGFRVRATLPSTDDQVSSRRKRHNLSDLNVGVASQGGTR